MMKKWILLIVGTAVLLITFGVAAYGLIKDKPVVTVVQSESFYSDFSVIDGKAHITCLITLKSTYQDEKIVTLSANFSDDVKTGLLKYELLDAEDSDNSIMMITIPPRSKLTYEITFAGDFGGTVLKHDRLLPDVVVKVVD